MNWFIFAVISAIFYSLFDFLIKLSSDKINIWLNAFLANFVSCLIALGVLLYLYFHGEKVFVTKQGGYLYTILAGIAITGAAIFFLKMFAVGTNLSLGVPIVRIGMVILGSLLGVILLKEGITLKYMLGFFLSIAGLYLIVTSR